MRVIDRALHIYEDFGCISRIPDDVASLFLRQLQSSLAQQRLSPKERRLCNLVLSGISDPNTNSLKGIRYPRKGYNLSLSSTDVRPDRNTAEPHNKSKARSLKPKGARINPLRLLPQEFQHLRFPNYWGTWP